MSFAEEMGHDIPNEYDDDRGYEGYSSSSWPGENDGATIETIDNVKIIHETNKAYLLKIQNKQYWVPISQVTLDKNILNLPKWLRIGLKSVKTTTNETTLSR